MTLYFIFLFLMPFQDHPVMGAKLFSLGSFPITPIKLVGIPLVAAAILLPRPRDAAPRPSPGILMLFAAFVLFQLLGTTLSSLSFPARHAETMISFAILIFATNMLVCTQHRLQMTIRAIVLVETFASTWLYKQYYIYHWARPLGPSADPNYEALSLVMTVPLAIWLNRYDESVLWKWIGRISTPILAFAVFVSQSRGGLLALIVMAALTCVYYDRKMRLVVGSVAAIALMLAIAPSQMLTRLQQIRLEGQAETGAEVSTRARIELARAGLRMMESSPVFGVGLGQFPSVEFKYNPELISLEGHPHIAHNTYVQLGAEGGILTLVLYLTILLLTLSTCRNAWKLPGVPDEIAALALAFQIGLIGIMVAEMFLTAEYIKEIWVFISLAPNLYAISAHTAAMSRKAATAPETSPATSLVLRPRLRAG